MDLPFVDVAHIYSSYFCGKAGSAPRYGYQIMSACTWLFVRLPHEHISEGPTTQRAAFLRAPSQVLLMNGSVLMSSCSHLAPIKPKRAFTTRRGLSSVSPFDPLLCASHERRVRRRVSPDSFVEARKVTSDGDMRARNMHFAFRSKTDVRVSDTHLHATCSCQSHISHHIPSSFPLLSMCSACGCCLW